MEWGNRKRTFTISFLVTALFLSVLYGAVIFLSFPKENKDEAVTVVEQTAEPLTMLVACADRGETPETLVALSILPSKGQVAYAALPGETALSTDDSVDTIASLWRDYGGRKAADSLSELIGAPIDRYVTIPKNSMVKLLDQAGTIDFSVPRQNRSDEPVRRILDGDAILSLVYRSPKKEKSRLVAELTGEILSQRGALLRSSDIEKIYLTAVNAGENDLTAVDYEMRREALDKLFSSGCTVAHIVINGTYNDEENIFSLSNSSISAMGLAFGR